MNINVTNCIISGFLTLTLLVFPACADSQESKSITYDQIIDPPKSRDLGHKIDVPDNYRVSSTEDTFYCESHTLTYKFSQNYENEIRSAQSLDILFDGQKVTAQDIRSRSNDMADYKFYDVKFRCVENTAGILIYGYKPGLNGTASSSKTFSIFFHLETGKIVE